MRPSFRVWFIKESLEEGPRIFMERKQFSYLFSFLIVVYRKGKGF